MTRAVPRIAGQPLLAIAVVLLLWIGLRSVLWESPFPAIADFLDDTHLLAGDGAAGPKVQPRTTSSLGGKQTKVGTGRFRPSGVPVPFAVSATMQRSYTIIGNEAGSSASHQRLWMAAMAHIGGGWEGPQANAMVMQASAYPAIAPASRSRPVSRWSFDSWVFLRQSAGNDRGAGPLPATYGGSQVGAVMRYRLSRSSPNRPSAYVRVTKALAGPTQGDISAGVSARPFAQLPFAAMVEGRLSRNGTSTEVRPAALVVSELPNIDLPLQFRGQAYAQAGYVGGDFATGFADGQMKLDRKLADFDLGTLHAGAGAWGGIQKGAERVDVGPTASLTMKVGDAPVRIAMDYRHRIAGDAVPQSGIALTVSTGF